MQDGSASPPPITPHLEKRSGRLTRIVAAACTLLASHAVLADSRYQPHQLMFGAAYYEEYLPYDRLDQDVAMMKAAHINVVRIAESTWSTEEPHNGVYDFSHIDRVLAAMGKANIKVIVGMPTYAIPTWLARAHPNVLVQTPDGQKRYGPRQDMDITDPDFRRAAEQIVRALTEHVANNPAVIGYQVDNETKSYNDTGPTIQRLFVEHMKSSYPSLDYINKEFGLDYWSNRINDWRDFPVVDSDVSNSNGTVNASLVAEFARFQRQQVTDYLAWEARLVRQYARPDQFVTQNFDLAWRNYSYGIQPAVDHFAAAKTLDIAGIDIYHPSQDHLTGAEISFGGDLARSLKDGRNYLVMETQAQGFPQWTPYPGQLRLQAFSHLASGADMVEYWHWSSIHNSVETYWRGLLGQDFRPNPAYEEARTIGRDFEALSPQLVNLKIHRDTAMLVSNDALTAYNWFGPYPGDKADYNDVVRPFYDALYRMNIGVDMITPATADLDRYKLIVVPALYATSDDTLKRLNDYVQRGGHIVYTFKSGFSNEHVKVRTTVQPGIITAATGVTYEQFVVPDKLKIGSTVYPVDDQDNAAHTWAELLIPGHATVLAKYDHPVWGQYAAVTENNFGNGQATYVGFMPDAPMIEHILARAAQHAGIWGKDQALHFPLIVKNGVNEQGHPIHYFFNYSANPAQLKYSDGPGTDLLSHRHLAPDDTLSLGAWGVAIVEEGAD